MRVERHQLYPHLFLIIEGTNVWHIDMYGSPQVVKYGPNLSNTVRGASIPSEMWQTSNALELLIRTGFTIKQVCSVPETVMSQVLDK